jgi:sirohydrochlorin ferrochelatase
VRALITRAAHAPADARPCITVLPRRRTPPVNDWVFRVIVEDPELQPYWTTVIGIREDTGLVTASREAIRQRIESFQTRVEPALESITDRLLASFLSAFQPSRTLAEDRERAIAEGLRQQRARLATSLLQPGLFDRRAERAASAQNATLEEALDQCAGRLGELARTGAVSIERRLVFGLVSR